MQVIVLATAFQQAALVAQDSVNVVWVNTADDFRHHASADAFFDLTYVNTPAQNALLAQLLPKLVVINSVADTLPKTNESFVRINGWNTFLSSPVLEAAAYGEEQRRMANAVFSFFGKTLQWLPDEPGFVTARVVSMIINEAYLALAEGVSTKEEIDTAMKLGTAYPFGPFEWAEKIGVPNIVALLRALSEKEKRYSPAALLLEKIAPVK